MRSDHSSKVFVDAATQIDNLGDDVILRQLLRRLAERAEVSVDVSRVPQWAREVIAVDPRTADARPGFSLRLLAAGLRHRVRPEAEPRVFLFLKPGHIGGRYGTRYSVGRAGLLALTLLCRAVGITVVRLGFSVNDCQGALLHLERLQSRAQHLYAPRDDVSVAYADQVGIRTNGRSADLAYTLGVVDNATVERRGVVLSFAGSTDGHPQPGYADRLAAFLGDYLATSPAGAHTWCAQVVRDQIFGDRVLAGHPEVTRVAFERSAASAEEVFGRYGSAELVLTNRLHAFLFALSQGALAVVVTDPAAHGKIVGIVEEMGLPELLIPLDGLTPAGLSAHLAELTRRREQILATAATYFDRQAARLDGLLDAHVGPAKVLATAGAVT
jgi:polysaccharide pyruvyl transferase WcaK-like protein